MTIKKEEQIKKAIEDSKKYFKENFKGKYYAPLINLKDVEKGIKGLAVANEICTLKWVLGKGKLNCYACPFCKGSGKLTITECDNTITKGACPQCMGTGERK